MLPYPNGPRTVVGFAGPDIMIWMVFGAQSPNVWVLALLGEPKPRLRVKGFKDCVGF